MADSPSLEGFEPARHPRKGGGYQWLVVDPNAPVEDKLRLELYCMNRRREIQVEVSERLRGERDKLADALRDLASYVGSGGFNAEEVDPAVFYEKIKWGIDHLTGALDRDARRYRRLQVLGCAPDTWPGLEEGLVLRFTNLDHFVDADLAATPSRGEA
jgi:hypothetical protein